jgi:hypothetical protein
MMHVRPGAERGATRLAWLDGKHSFSFGQYYDPRYMGFGPLRVINEDVVAPGGGFATHPHANMEIITYILAGALEHKDSLGTGSVIRPGEVQRMSAGSGITHSEFNHSKTEPVHLLQIWIQPDRLNITPSYEQKTFAPDSLRGLLRVVASNDARDGSVRIQQDARVYASVLSAGQTVRHELGARRRVWVQVARGAIAINGHALSAGDGFAAWEEAALDIAGTRDAELLLFDLP